MQNGTAAAATARQPERAFASELAQAWRAHWPEYLMEAGALGAFMVSACVFTALLEHPASPARQAIASPTVRLFLNGLAMGLTLIAIIHSPWGKRSGAQMNPALTLAFFRLGKIGPWDTLFYAVFQFIGGVAGVAFCALAIGGPIRDIHYVVTVPGPRGAGVAFAAEFLISFALMTAVLVSTNTPRLARRTPLICGALLTLYITFEAPLSGMSMNPARTFGSALPGATWTAIWVYFIAPAAAMLAAGELYRFRRGARAVFCAKLHHHNDKRCIFRCNYPAMQAGRS
ncbi:MAG: aquaporin [Bryobacteraceae bacterium]|nr:aquaporin [Bryobacteraceae bacterium]